jgi:signal recognition particle subunit SEC65
MVSKNDRIWVLYPEYFESGRSRTDGRRVNRHTAMRKVKSREIFEAAASLDLGPVLEKSHHPSDWHRHRGRVLVRKEFSKEETIRKVALEMRKRREEAKRMEADEREASFR